MRPGRFTRFVQFITKMFRMIDHYCIVHIGLHKICYYTYIQEQKLVFTTHVKRPCGTGDSDSLNDEHFQCKFCMNFS